MKTKMSKVLGIACLLVCTATGVQGQPASWKYPKVENGNTIISRDAAGGIKSEALLTDAQKNWLNTTNIVTTIYYQTSEYNKVSGKLQVAASDAFAACAWEDAYSHCETYSESGAPAGSWRLPTQRELALIWVFKAKLTGCGTLPLYTNKLWSSTTYDFFTVGRWLFDFTKGELYCSNGPDNASNYVRCVRDL